MDSIGKITSFLLIRKGCELLDAHKERILAMFFFVLETVSVVLDQIGKNKGDFLLAALLLSAFGFAITLYSFIKARTNPTMKAEIELKVVEIVFSLIQLIVTFINFLKPKNDYNASAIPLAFVMISVVFVFIKDGKNTESSPTNLLPVANFQQPISSMTSTHIEINQTVSSTNQVRPGSSTGKRLTHVRYKKLVMKLETNDDKTMNKKAMDTVFDISGVASFSMDLEDNKLTMIGNFVPGDVMIKLEKICQTQLISDEPKKEKKMEAEMEQKMEPEKKKMEPQMEQKMEPQMKVLELVKAYRAYMPNQNPYYHEPKEENKREEAEMEQKMDPEKKKMEPEKEQKMEPEMKMLELVKTNREYMPNHNPYYLEPKEEKKREPKNEQKMELGMV